MASDWTTRLLALRRVGFDSNALIYLLEGRQPYAAYVAEITTAMERGHVTGYISTIVEMELLVKPMRERDIAARDRIEIFLRHMPNLVVRPVTRVVARRAAEVRARTRLAPMDAIIVATGLEDRCDAIVGNDSLIASRSQGIPYLYLDDYVS
jgi:predicted nucleic acid-binding protein